MKNLIVGQSGGPTAVINSSLYGVIQEGLAQKETIGHVYGMINGIEGFLKGNYTDLAELDPQTLNALRTTPGAYLGRSSSSSLVTGRSSLLRIYPSYP